MAMRLPASRALLPACLNLAAILVPDLQFFGLRTGPQLIGIARIWTYPAKHCLAEKL